MVCALLDIIDEQQSQIEAMGGRLDALSQTHANCYQRHENQVADLRKEIDRLKGVHGA